MRVVSQALVLLSFLFASCAQTRVWQCQRIATGEMQYDSLRIVCPAQDKVNDIEVEVLKTDLVCTVMLCVHGQPLTPSKNHPHHTPVHVKIADKSFKELASLHSGGQRVKLSPALQEAILAQLRAGGFVEIELAGYKKRIDADNFPGFCKMLDSPPHFQNPIQLAF